MKSLSFVCLFLLFACCVLASSIPEEVLNGFYHGRSSDVVVFPRETSDDAVLFLQSQTLENFKSDLIQDKDVSDLISHLLGCAPINIDTSRVNFPRTDIFNQPRANLLFAVDSVGKELISRLSLEFPGQQIVLKRTSFPSNSLAELTTLSTGVSPSAHGIVSNSWTENGKHIEAFGSNGQSAVPNFADILDSNFNGRSRIVVVSGDRQFASALCPHASQICVFWNPTKKTSLPLSQKYSGQIKVSEKEIINTIAQSKSFKESSGLTVQFNSAQKTIQVTHGDITVDFHLNNERELSFLAELELVRSFRSEIQLHASNDAAPHHFAFAFSSLTGLIEAHGANSNIVLVAVRMAHATVLDTIEALKTTFEDRVVSEVVLLGDYRPIHSDNSDSQYETHRIPQHRQVRSLAGYQFTLDTNNNTVNATLTLEDLTYFHIILWVSLTLALFLAAFIYTFSEISSGRDTLLFSTGARPHAS